MALVVQDKEGAVECYSQGLSIGWKAIDEFQGLAEDDFRGARQANSVSKMHKPKLSQRLDTPKLGEVTSSSPRQLCAGLLIDVFALGGPRACVHSSDCTEICLLHDKCICHLLIYRYLSAC